MFLRTLSIRREGDYGYSRPDPAKPFRATIEMVGETGKVELLLSPEMSKRILDIVAEEVAAAGRATAEMMTAEVFDQPKLEAA